jgi:hypothetical protein
MRAAHVALVDDVVVQQRRGVHELDRRRELHVTVARVAGEPRHGDGEDRTQPLAAGIDQVVRDLRDHRHFGAGARQDRGVDPIHVGGDEVDQPVDRGRGDGFERDDDGQGGLSGALGARLKASGGLEALSIGMRSGSGKGGGMTENGRQTTENCVWSANPSSVARLLVIRYARARSHQ